ncbi:hypothetical protein AGLY_009884 [Aphis glycines]|uniref:Uncharacterized protein n=1 Tax=Aphis glycines TaxID=307491 RepID=A0A6G0THI1_APHGL|nr:hypothetical protein AGLY_009884 [Aphis glycines]
MLQFQTSGVVFDIKVNILVFTKKIGKTLKSNGKIGIFTRNQFLTKPIFLYSCNLKTNHCKYLKFSPNIYICKFSIFLMSIKKCWVLKKTLTFNTRFFIIKIFNSKLSIRFPLNSYRENSKAITSRNNTSISNIGSGFRWKSEYSWCIKEVKSKHFPTVFKKIEKNKKKMTEKREFLRKTSFRLNRFFYMVVIKKLITTTAFFNFSEKNFLNSNFYVIYRKRENLQVFLQVAVEKTRSIIMGKILSAVDLIVLALSKYLKIVYKVPHMHNFFLLAFEVQILTKIRKNHEYLQIIL